MKTILITGTGLTAMSIGKLLISNGYNIHFLTRNPSKFPQLKVFKWDISKSEIDLRAFENVTSIFHLAGAGISDRRWSKSRKKEILNSRTKSTELLFNTVKTQQIKIKSFIAASAIGYYGTLTSNKIFQENDPPSTDYLGSVCEAWENSINRFSTLNIRTVILRTGVVLARNGGAFEKITKPVRMNLGASLGLGNQYMPWIHLNDISKMYLFCLQNNNVLGTYNAVAPAHVKNHEITKLIAQKLNTKIWFPNIPSFLLNLLFGEMSVILTKGSRVSSNKILKEGFNFSFEKIEHALNDLLKS